MVDVSVFEHILQFRSKVVSLGFSMYKGENTFDHHSKWYSICDLANLDIVLDPKIVTVLPLEYFQNVVFIVKFV